jgi:serine phosphatase RsbU (regulator of sigma subunit)
MKVRTKIIGSLIVTILLVSVISLLFMTLSANEIRRGSDALIADLDRNIEDNVRQELLDLAVNIRNYTLAFEGEIERNMRNAANVLYEADRMSGGTLAFADMERIKAQTGMSDLYLGGVDGIFTISTEPGGAGVSLFDIWDGYRMLITGEADFMASDLSMKVETGEIFKFALIPRAAKRGIVESALEAGVIEEQLQSFIDTNKGIRLMNLFDANLLTLTENHAHGVHPEYIKGSFVTEGVSEIRPFFNGSGEPKLAFDKNNAKIYYPVSDKGRIKYVLYIDLDTSGYFNTGRMINGAMTEAVRQSLFFNEMSLTAILAVLLIFTAIISVLINRILSREEDLMCQIKDQNETIMESIEYASKIQKNLLPQDAAMSKAFSDYSVIWKPRDVVGGDIYWMKQFDTGTVLCVADCTGHGIPGALLTMLVVSVFETLITEKNHRDTQQILYMLDHRLAAVLQVEAGKNTGHGIMDINDGCDLAVLFIAKDGSVTFSAGQTSVFVCDGKDVQRFKGQRLFIGEGKLKSKEEVKAQIIPAMPEKKFYIASDGLYDQPGGRQGISFGLKTFERILVNNNNKTQDVISGMIWDAFEEYRGPEPMADDFTLITFKP